MSQQFPINATYHLLAHQSPMEIRVIQPATDKKKSQVLANLMVANEAELVSTCEQWDGKANVYVGSRDRRAGFQPTKTQSAKKRDITAITVIPIDIDPKRPKGLEKQAATDAELQYALDAADYFHDDYFPTRGFCKPIRAMSGNGVQLWICVPRYEIPDDGWIKNGKSESHAIEGAIKTFFGELQAALPSELTAKVKIDSIYDLPRLIKVIGTMSVKGDPNRYPDRPHRRSDFIDEPVRTEDPYLLDYLLEVQARQSEQRKQKNTSNNNGKQQTSQCDDADVLHLLMRSANGEKFSWLYFGNRTGYESESESDCALLARLLWGTQHDEAQAIGLFEASPYFSQKDDEHRQKWEGRADYRERTIAKALEGLGMYDPDYSSTHTDNGKPDHQTVEAIRSDINNLDQPTPARIQNLLWDVVVDASYWSRVDFGRFCDELNTQYRITKTWIKRWMGAVLSEKRKRAARFSTENAATDLPVIVTTDRHMRVVTGDLMTVIVHANDEKPSLFVRSGMPTQVKVDENGHAIAAPLTLSATRGIMGRVADFMQETDIEGERLQKPVNPPTDIANDFLSLPSYPDLPPLTSIVGYPFVTPNGQIHTAEGYEPQSMCYLHNASPLEIGDTEPTEANLTKAKQVLLDEVLGDFPFVDSASQANTIAEMLTPLVRQMIAGATPLFAHDAATPGTGKSLLASVCTIPFSVSGASVMTACKEDEEWRKKITSKLLTGTSHILIDNVKGKLSSGDLAAALTTKSGWEDRILGRSQMVRIPVRCTWIATGNNLEFSDEIARRAVWIRLDAGMERPWKRTEFRHENLEKWTADHRGEILTALLTFVRKWIADGKPKSDVTLGSYEEWSHIVGGILKAVGIDGFLANAEKLYDQLDSEREAWVDFFSAWAETHGAYDPHSDSWGAWIENGHAKPEWQSRRPEEIVISVGTSELFALASHFDDKDDGEGEGLLDLFLGRGNERARRVNLGRLLKKHKDRIFGGYKLECLDKKVKRLTQYRLINVHPAPVDVSAGVSNDLDTPSSEVNNDAASGHVHDTQGVSSVSNSPPRQDGMKTHTTDIGSMDDLNRSETEWELDTLDTPNRTNESRKANTDAASSDGVSSEIRYTTDTNGDGFSDYDDSDSALGIDVDSEPNHESPPADRGSFGIRAKRGHIS